MAMNKKEREQVEALLTEAALRRTVKIEADIFPPALFGELSTGFLYGGEMSDHPRVEVACSSIINHAFGRTDKTTTQKPIALFSTRLMALKALRYAVESECCKRLRNVDRMIEAEHANA